jgi:hypothetical protein
MEVGDNKEELENTIKKLVNKNPAQKANKKNMNGDGIFCRLQNQGFNATKEWLQWKIFRRK